MSLTIDRIASSIQKELSKILQIEAHEEILKLVTVTEVRVTNDLSFATIFYSCLADDSRKKKIDESFTRAKGYLKNEVAKRVKMRKVPEFVFKYDEALEYGNKIDKILNEIK